MSAPVRFCSFLFALAATGACDPDRISHDPDAGTPVPEAVSVSGTMVPSSGHEPPATGKVIVLWSVRSASGSSAYKFGEGTSTAQGFSLQLPSAPPAGALNGGALGVGVVYLLASNSQIADGPVDEASVRSIALGATGDDAIVYQHGALASPAWVTAFPQSYSCGEGEGRTSPQTGYAPQGCDVLDIEVDDPLNIRFVDWGS